MKTKILVIITSLSLTISCIDRDYAEPLEAACVSKTVTKTVAEIRATATSTPTLYLDDDIIEAYVTSSDEGGNFFKSISMVSTDNQIGFSIPVDQVTLYADYEPGRKVYVNLKNRFISVDQNTMVIGNDNINPSFPAGLSRLNLFEYQNVIQKSCDKINEDDIVIESNSISQILNTGNLNKLIELDGVQFAPSSLGKSFYDPTLNSIGSATNHDLVDANGNSIVLRVSMFSNFSGKKIPLTSGKVRGVLTQFNGTYQFLPRSINDIKLNDPRIFSFSFVSSLNETFESFGNNFSNFSDYLCFSTDGSRLWRTESFSGNRYLQMSAFNSNAAQQNPLNKAYFIVPVDFGPANNISFKTQDRFNNGNVLRVYYSTDYIPFTPLSNATLVDITSNFTLATGNTGSNSLPFVNSGVYNFPAALMGNGFVIFEYTGGYSFSPAITTNMHIDDIVIN